MKRLFAITLCALLLLSSCQSGPAPTSKAAPTVQNTAPTGEPDVGELELFADSKPVCQLVLGARAKWMTEYAFNDLKSSLGRKSKSNVTYNYDAHITPGLVPIYVGDTTSEISQKLAASLGPDEIGVLIENGEVAIGAGTEDFIDEACLLFNRKLLSSGLKAGRLAVPAQYSTVAKISVAYPELPGFDNAAEPTRAYCGDGFFMFNFNKTSTESYRAYTQKLADNGFEKKSENDFGGNLYATFSDGSTDVHLSHFGLGQYTRVVAGPASPLVPREEGEVSSKALPVEVGVLGLKNFGLSMVVRLKNSKFIVIDGGQQDGSQVLVDYLEAHAPEGETPVIAAWIFTHAHPDHTYALYGMQQNSLFTRVSVERFVFNFPSPIVYSKYEPACVEQTQNVISTMKDFFPDAEIVKPHAGNRMVLGGVTVDFISTQEEVLPNRINDFNDTSIVMKFSVDGATMLVTGDMSVGDFSFNNANISPDALKCDVLQFAHHGGNNNVDFYGSVDPEVIIVPNNDPKSFMTYITSSKYPISQFAEKSIRQYSNVETVTFPLPYTEDTLPPSHVYDVL